MTRIVGGAARGRRLRVPPGGVTRPTSDRAREAMFSTLDSLLGAWAGRRVLDLYAGSGAVGLEALSRGATHVLFVESQVHVARVLAGNIDAVGLAGARLRRVRVERLTGDQLAPPPYDVVFADPPYDLPDSDLATVLDAIRPGLSAGAVTVVERATRGASWGWPTGFTALRSRAYGEATLWYGRATGAAPAGTSGTSGTEESTG